MEGGCEHELVDSCVAVELDVLNGAIEELV